MKNIIIALALAVISITTVVIIYNNTNTLYRNCYDDAAISMRYAINLAEHGQLVYNLNERVDSASSFLYTVILALFYRVGIHNLAMVSFLFNMLSLGLIAGFVYLCALKLSGNIIISILLALISSLHGFISGWAILGMDTIFFTALLCAFAYSMLYKKSELSMWLVILIALTRPEGILILSLWLVHDRKILDILIVIGIISLFYLFKYLYYGTLISHAVQFKQLTNYYESNPMQIISTWVRYALIVPVMCIIGMIMDIRVRWLGVYIIISIVACLLGPRSDWVRYSVPMLPLMLICGAPVFKNWKVILIVLPILLYQNVNSIKWMYSNAANLSPVQEARLETGKLLQDHGDKSRWVLSGDLGAIGYAAKDFKIIDTFGLCSYDVLNNYKHNTNLDSILSIKHPLYIADTFNIIDGQIVYTHLNGSFLKHRVQSNYLSNKKLTPIKLYSWDNKPYVIGLAEIK